MAEGDPKERGVRTGVTSRVGKGMRAARRQRGLLLSQGSDQVSFEESFRMLRSSLEVSLADIDHPIIAVTSSKENEGKTVVATKLALSFVQAGRRVVLVDLDLRHATAHRLLRTHNEFGTSDVLLGNRTLQEAIQRLEIRNNSGGGNRSLYFLGTGPPVQNPTELLGSGRTARLVDRLARQADLVLIDTPPVLPVADTLVIGRIASGALMVVENRTTAFPALEKAKNLLIRNQTRLLGIVLNKFQVRDSDGMYGYYGYGYGEAPVDVPIEEPAEVLFDQPANNGSLN